MDSPLPDDLAELERELAGRPRQEPAAEARARLLAAVERELNEPPASISHSSWIRRRPWRLAFAGAAAAAVITAVFVIWNRRVHVPLPGPGGVEWPSTAQLPAEPDDTPLTWGAARALGDSPEALEATLKRRPVEDRVPWTRLQAFTRLESESVHSKGDM
jgi:hypothetical protein